MHMFRALRRSRVSAGLMILALAGLAACGGGGGGGGGNNGGGGGGGTGLTLSLSTSAITFSALPPFAPAPEIVTATLTGTGTGTLFIIVATSNPAVANVTNVIVTGPTTGQGTIVPASPAVLGAGTHTATIQVRACLNDPTCATGQVGGSPRTITVTYNVTGVASSLSNLTYNIGNVPADADLTRSFNVTGFPAQMWSITDDVPWLDLSPTTGSAAAAVSVNANLAAVPLDELNNGTFSGTVTLTPTNGSPVQIAVTLNVSRTQVNYVSPYVAQSGVPGDVIIRGDNFQLMTPSGVRFGTADDATVFNVVSNTEIRASHAALPAGSYDVHVLNDQGLDRTRAQLKVVDAPTFTATTLQYPQGPDVHLNRLLYDAERRAVFAAIHYNMQSVESGRLVRWGYTSSAWEAPTQVQYLFPNAPAFTPDGTKLLVAHHDPLFQKFAVAEVDPVTLAQTRMTRFTQDYEASGIAVANNGEAVIIGDLFCCSGFFPVFIYSHLTGELRQPMQPSQFFSLQSGLTGGSADGSLVLVPSDDSAPTVRYDSEARELVFNPVSVRARFAPQMNRNASRILFDFNTVYDSNLALLGRLPPLTTVTATLHPTELRAYAYDTDGTIRVYDLSASTDVDGNYPEILPAITPIDTPGDNGLINLTITPDGGTLFLGGREQIVVVPVP